MSLSPGTRLGPYEIVSPIGAGGMGEVYRAKDTRLDRTVAMKVLAPHLASSVASRQRFEREARTISQLSHPHICALYDVGREGEVEYLVMEYLEGETLAERLMKGALPFEQVVRYGIEIADALDKAHRSGVVHRDLKPGNVMITTSGVKLLDFGLAKAMAQTRAGPALTALPTETRPSNLTEEGAILGTFQYMAPEQVEGKEADARTDIFAFGAVLYEMATGRKAFAGSSRASLMSSIMKEDPAPISTIAPTTPPAFDRLVRRCLAKDPDRRWQSARDVALELEEVTAAAPSPVATPPKRSRLAAAAGWLVAAALLVALLASLFGPWRQATAPAAAVRFSVSPPPASTFQGMLALSPDGTRLAFVATAPDGRDLLWTRPLDSIESRVLEGTDGASYPFWSPDGRFLAFFAQGKLKRIESSGGTPQTLCDAPAPRGGTWGARGAIVFSANAGGEIDRVSDAGGRAVALSHLTSKGGDLHRWPSFLPDGRHFLFFRVAGEPGRTGVSVAAIDSAETSLLAEADSGAAYSGGSLFYRRGDRLMRQAFDASRLRPTGEAVSFVEDVWWDGISTLATAFAASSTGVIAFQTGGLSSTRLLWYDRSGREVGSVGPPGAYIEPALSPDGRWLAVGRSEAGKLGIGLWMIDLARDSSTRVSSGEHLLTATPLWSPDGRRVLFAAFPSGEVYVRDAQGAKKEELLYKAAAFTPLDDWSRDGRLLFYETINWPTFHFDVGVRDLQGGTERPLITAPYNNLGARLSPDGRWLAFESQESGVSEMFVQSFPEGNVRLKVSSAGGTQARWRGDGRELFYVSPDRKVMAVEIRTAGRFETGTPRPLFQTRILPTIEARNHYDVSSDGQRFIVNSRRPEDASLLITVVIGAAPNGHR